MLRQILTNSTKIFQRSLLYILQLIKCTSWKQPLLVVSPLWYILYIGGSVFEGLEKGQKSSLNPSKVFNFINQIDKSSEQLYEATLKGEIDQFIRKRDLNGQIKKSLLLNIYNSIQDLVFCAQMTFHPLQLPV